MCGIAGFVDYHSSALKRTYILDNMVRSLAHRGPDSAGSWVSHTCALGHRRLIVQDRIGGAQPMSVAVAGESYTLVYNGELYNTYELRNELISRGHIFKTHSDTEVLLLAYIQWGPSCVDKLNGIFAFAVWEENKGRLFLCRDRMGVKPLYYSILGDVLIFASEIKALLKYPGIHPVVDEEGLTHLFALSPARVMGKTPFKNIVELKAGECLVFSKNGHYTHTYWQFSAHPHEDNLTQTIDKLRFLVTDAITRQLISDVGVGTFLSGGLDSSAISAVAAGEYKRRNKQLKTFSIDYTENDKYFSKSLFQPNADGEYVKRMKDFLQTEHIFYECGIEELVEALPQALRARDLPGMADVDSSLLLFCEKVKENVTVALSGECADELFGGYPWFHQKELPDVFPWGNSIPLRNKLLKLPLPLYDYAKTAYSDCLNEAPVDGSDHNSANHIRKILYANVKYFMANLLCRKDTMSMACGLEVRVPYADHRIAEYAYNIPWDIMCHNGREKGILRQALKGLLPDDILERKKSPYPKTHHPLYTKLVSQQLKKVMDGPECRLKEICDMGFVQQLLTTGCSEPFFGQLMTGPQLIAFLLGLEQWLCEYEVQLCL